MVFKYEQRRFRCITHGFGEQHRTASSLLAESDLPVTVKKVTNLQNRVSLAPMSRKERFADL